MFPESRERLIMYINKDKFDPIKAKQFDARSRFLEIQLLDTTAQPYNLSGCRVQFNAEKPDGTYIMNDCELLSPTEGVFVIELTDQTLAKPGVVKADIRVFADNNRVILSTRTFDIQVQETKSNDAAVESSNEYNSVVILFQDVYDMRDIIREMHSLIGTLDDELQSGQGRVSFSIMGVLNKIWYYLISQSTAAIADMVTQILARVGVANPATGDRTTIMNYLRLMENLGSIKSTQWGIVTPTSTADIVIPISQVNIQKCEIKIYPGALGYQSSTLWAPMIKSRTNTSFTVTSHYVDRGTPTAPNPTFYSFSWEVIEMY